MIDLSIAAPTVLTRDELMSLAAGRLLKRLPLPDGGSVDIVARHDGAFQFFQRGPTTNAQNHTKTFESGAYISLESAEAAARLKFNLG